MKDYKIISYIPQYKDELVQFIKQTHPDYSNVYIEYCVNNASGHFNSVIVLNKDNHIVGCHLCFNTTIKVNGTIIPTVWGHDTFLNVCDRKYIGLDFVLTLRNPYGMGIGLTDVNERIHKKTKSPFLSGYYNIFSFNVLAPLFLFFNHGKKKKIIKKEEIKVNNYIFGLVESINQINVVNGGYWYEDTVDADLYRGETFLKTRFFDNKVFDYYIFNERNNTSCYFVLRPICYKRIPALLLVDYRYDTSKPYLVESILKAVKKIALHNRIGLIMTTAGEKRVVNFFNGLFTLRRRTMVVYGKKLQLTPRSTMPITPADSDIDYHR